MLLTFGYKLIKQTQMIPLDEMTFDRGKVPTLPQGDELHGRLEKLLAWLMVI